MRVPVRFDTNDYDPFTGGSISFSLTEKQCAYLLSLLPLMLERGTWQTMSDSAWDTLEEEISTLIGILQ
jgi:hypothetical protein